MRVFRGKNHLLGSVWGDSKNLTVDLFGCEEWGNKGNYKIILRTFLRLGDSEVDIDKISLKNARLLQILKIRLVITEYRMSKPNKPFQSFPSNWKKNHVIRQSTCHGC